MTRTNNIIASTVGLERSSGAGYSKKYRDSDIRGKNFILLTRNIGEVNKIILKCLRHRPLVDS